MNPDYLGLSSNYIQTEFGALHYMAPLVRNSDAVILMIHGFGSSWIVWKPLIESIERLHLAKGRDIIAIDLPGLGSSENTAKHLDAPQLGQMLIKSMHDLGYSKLHIVGHSMGGFLALDMAQRYPADITSLHIVSGTYFTLLEMVNHPLRSALKSPLIASFYGFQLTLTKLPRLANLMNYHLSRRNQDSLKPKFQMGGPTFRYGAHNARDYDANRLWGRITIPTTGVFGGRDRLVTKRDKDRLQSIIPHARLTMLAQAGHSSLIDAPDDVAIALFGDQP